MRLPAVVVVVLAWGQTQALAQTSPPPSPPPFYLDFAALPQPTADVLTTTNDPSLFGDRDRLWEFRTGSARDLGKGLVFSADVVGRRGYRLPLYLSDPIGSKRTPIDVLNASEVDMSQRHVDWLGKLGPQEKFVPRTRGRGPLREFFP